MMLEPADEAEMAAAIASADAPLRIVGGGTRLGIGPEIGGRNLSTRRISGIIRHEPAALTLVVRAGTPVQEVIRLLASHNQHLAFEPPDWRALMGSTGTATIGAVASCNLSGPRRVAAGAARDFLLGIRFADGMGNLVKSGGRVMKNVTGLDLTRLLAGSHGTLGVITELAFKVLPRPEASLGLTFRGLAIDASVRAMAGALASPFEVSGAAHDPQSGETLLRLEGFAATLPERAERLRSRLGEFGMAEVGGGPALAARWKEIGDVTSFASRSGDVWRLSVRPGDAPGILARIAAAVPNHRALLDWGGGLIWLLVPPADSVGIRAALAPAPGHATLIRASAETRAAIPVFHPQTPRVEALSSALRQKFDPRCILNPGLMSAGRVAA